MVQRILLNHYLARTAGMLSGARRASLMLLVMLLTSISAWADSWTDAGGTGGSGTAEDPYFVNMPAKDAAATIDHAATLTIPSGITSFKLYDDGGSSERYSNNNTGYLIITAPANYVLQITGDIDTERDYDKLTVFDNGTASDPKLLDAVSGTLNNINVHSSDNVITVYFNSDNGINVSGLDLTVEVRDLKDLRVATISGLQSYYPWNNGSAININYTVKDAHNTTLTKGTDYTETIKKGGVVVNNVIDAGDYTLEITGKGSYSGTTTASFTVIKMFSGSGTKADPYLISTADDWMSFCYENNADAYWASGVYVKLAADVGTTENPVTTMVGTSETNAFQGTFDGGGHTLTIQYGTADSRCITTNKAPFAYANGALIKNLHTAGFIYTSTYNCSGIVGWNNNSNILNCRSSVTIDATANGQYGFACNTQNSNITIKNCLFDGQIINTGYGAGFASNYANSSVQITNSLFAPTNMQGIGTFYTFVDQTPYTITNSYERYTNNAIISQGTNANGMSLAELAAALGPIWEVSNEGGVDKVLPILNTHHVGGATITGLEPLYRYTGSAVAVSYSLKDVEGNDLIENTDYSVSLTCNGTAVATVQAEGDYTITFTGMGSYTGAQEVSFKVMAYPDGLSIDYDYSLGDDGYFYVNAPINSTANVDLTGETEGFSFKVYDNGGKNGKYNCGVTETVVMTAPTGYVLQVVGSAQGQSSDQLCIYNGNSTSSPALYNQNPPSNIGTVISTGESMTIYYKTSNAQQSDGLDLTVKLINVNTNYDINIDNPTTGGEVNSNSPTAKVNSVVTLTAVPSNNYELEGITVIDGNSNNISVDGGKWYSNNTATFSMPGTAVTVTPTFNTKKSAADGLYINMPTNGTINATIPAGVTSFKLYDDGGASGNYSRICNGDMVLTAPTGYRFKLSGTICTEYSQSWSGGDLLYLNVYDGASDTDGMLISNKRCTVGGVEEAIQTVYSTANTMMVRFNNNANSVNTNAYGLNLTVELINENASYDVTVNNTEEHGIINSDKATSKATEVITLTATTDNGYIVNSISVTDGSSQPVEVEGGAWYSYYAENKATFVMPNSNATVASTFTAAKTAEAGLYVNMEKTKPLNVAIPTGIESFKVYDNGGASGNYPANCRSTVVLTAPEGYQLKLTGTVATDAQHDNLMVYDGTDEDNNHILLNDFESTAAGVAKDIGTITSSGRSMRLYFWTNSDDNVAAGLDLKVEVMNSNTKHNITFDNSDAGGDASATMSEAAIDEAVALTLTPASAAYLPSGINITSSSPAKLAWTGSFSNTATMTMPYADVTIAPTFTNTWTAAGGLLAMIPRDGNASATIPAGVQSFKIYDHSGPTANYDEHVEGSLTLTAPTGYKHQLTGTVTTEDSDVLWVEDVTANTYLLNMFSSTTDGDPRDIGTVTSSGETISLTFRTDWGQEYAGLDLTSTLLPIEYTITYDGLDGATLATANPTTYTIESDDFTLTNPTRDGYTFAGWTGTGLGAVSTSVTVTKGNTGTRSYTATWTENIATLDESTTPLAELTAMSGKQTKVRFERTGLTAGKYSTICLPYDFTASETCTFYTFVGVKKEGDDWVADISAHTGTLAANTPYIFTTATATSVTFSNDAVTAAASYSDASANTSVTDWTFQGTYSQISLPKTDEYDYGFAAGSNSNVQVGSFVHLTSGASAAPFRAYLRYTGSDANWAKAPNRSGAANDAMPSRIIVRIVGADGNTTAIGTLDTRTGEIIPTGDYWYSLDGHRLQGKPSTKGIYIHNGRKEVLK